MYKFSIFSFASAIILSCTGVSGASAQTFEPMPPCNISYKCDHTELLDRGNYLVCDVYVIKQSSNPTCGSSTLVPFLSESIMVESPEACNCSLFQDKTLYDINLLEKVGKIRKRAGAIKAPF